MTKREPPPYLWATAAGLAVLGLYIFSLAPTTAFWDTSEYIAAAKVLGIPHPPGNPLFVLMAHVFGLLPLAPTYAERINLFAAVTSAAAAGFWFLVSDRWLRAIVPLKLPRLVATFGGVLVGATMWTVWNQSTVNEKVYTVSLFFMAMVTWLAVHWGDDEPGPHRDRWLILIAYLLALTSTNHMMGVLAAPAVAVYVLWTDWRVLTRPRVLLGVADVPRLGGGEHSRRSPLGLGIDPTEHDAIGERWRDAERIGDLADGILDDAMNIMRFDGERHLATCDPRNIEEIIDQSRLQFGILPDGEKMRACFLRKIQILRRVTRQ